MEGVTFSPSINGQNSTKLLSKLLVEVKVRERKRETQWIIRILSNLKDIQ